MSWYKNQRIIIRRIYIFILLFGIDFKKILNLSSLPRYFKDYFKFKKKGGKTRNTYICLEDFNNEATEFKNQFFHSDLIVSQKIFEQNPKDHLDIGSRIDGLVSHVASYRSLDFADIRNIKIFPHKNINIQQIDIGDENLKIVKKYSSISSVGVLGHVGLGRYGDKVDPYGHLKSFKNISKLADKSAILYLMVPIGKEGVEFNSHRVFKAFNIIEIFKKLNFDLIEFNFVDDSGELHLKSNIKETEKLNFGGGIFIFKKK